MARQLFGRYNLLTAMQEEGLLPPECADVQILVPVDGIMQIVYTVNVGDERMMALQRALQKTLESNRGTR